MKPETRRCKCLHCKQLFVPDYRNRERQKYCSTPACKRASKRARQQRLVEQAGEPRLLPRCPERAAGAGVAQSPSGLLEAFPAQSPPYVTRRLLAATDCDQRAYTSAVTSPLPPVRYKMSARCKCLCWWGLSPNSPTVRYKTTSSFSSGGLIAKGQDILDQPSSRSAKENTVYDEQKDPAPGPLAASAGAV